MTAKPKKLHEGKAMVQPTPHTGARLLSRVKKRGNGCWLWKGAKDSDGYGTMSVNGKSLWVHRVAYAAFVAPLRAGDTVHHTCHNASCVNPHHLEVLDHRENSRRNNGKASEPSEVPF